MGFGDKLKELRQQAQEAVSEHSEKIHDVVDAAAVAANEKTHGKYTNKIAKFGEKAGGAVDKFGASEEGSPEAAADAPAAAEAPAAPAPSEPEAPVAPPAAAPAAPPAAAPAANPDLAAWAAGDDQASKQ